MVNIAVTSFIHSKCRVLQRLERPKTSFYVCVLFVAKTKPNERLVEKPTSRDRVLTCIQAHLEYFESWSKLKTFTAQKLKDKRAS